MQELRRCNIENRHKTVPDSFILRYGACMMPNEDFKDVVRFDKSRHNSDFLGVSAEGGYFIYGNVRQFENFYGSDSINENVSPPVKHKISNDDLTDFCFRSDNRVFLLSMAGLLCSFDLNSKGVLNSVKNPASSVFCEDSDNQNCVLIGNCMTSDLKLYDFRDPNQVKSVSSVNNAPFPDRKVKMRRKLKSLCHLNEKYFASGFSQDESCVLVWDMRFVKSSKPSDRLKLFSVNRDNFGVYCMRVDQTRTRLIAACTDGCFREYAFLSGSENPTNFYFGGLTKHFDRSFAFSPISDHFIAPTKDSSGIWDMQKSALLDSISITDIKSPIKLASPSRTILTPKRSILSATQKISQLALDMPINKVRGLASPTFRFKSSNEQSMQHCDWSICGRYIVISTDTSFKICNSESEWARNANNDSKNEYIPINLSFPLRV